MVNKLVAEILLALYGRSDYQHRLSARRCGVASGMIALNRNERAVKNERQ